MQHLRLFAYLGLHNVLPQPLAGGFGCGDLLPQCLAVQRVSVQRQQNGARQMLAVAYQHHHVVLETGREQCLRVSNAGMVENQHTQIFHRHGTHFHVLALNHHLPVAQMQVGGIADLDDAFNHCMVRGYLAGR